MAYINTSATAEIGMSGRIATLVKSARAAMHRRRVYNQTLSELRALSNRELNDLGLSRSMISRVALEATYGK